MLRRALFFTFFFFNDTATTEIYTLSLHDALPILLAAVQAADDYLGNRARIERSSTDANIPLSLGIPSESGMRSEEHTSELQSHLNLVCRLLLEKKKK